jgi:rubredoxin
MAGEYRSHAEAELGSPLREFRCAGCGYGASCRIAPERCPMCSGSVWDFVPNRVLGTVGVQLDAQAPLGEYES